MGLARRDLIDDTKRLRQSATADCIKSEQRTAIQTHLNVFVKDMTRLVKVGRYYALVFTATVQFDPTADELDHCMHHWRPPKAHHAFPARPPCPL